jgi:hypothetical protein
MPLSWNEIKDRALRFSHDWADEASENAEAKSFWDAFFTVFGLSRRRVATFEQPVKKSDGKGGFIDLLWKGILIVEHKSRGKDLDRAVQQAKDYFPGLKDRDLPRYILVSDFARFRLFDLDEGIESEFPLSELYQNVRLFGFIAGYQTTSFKEQDAVNIKAAERMGKLHDKLYAIGYTGHELEVYLVRLLFCLFADDTSIFERRQFQDLIEQRTAEDGQDLAQWLGNLFEVLDKPREKRLTRLDEQLADFPYVNGSLFAEHLHTAAFDREMRDILLDCCALDWSRISPAIFGALFQSVMNPTLRRNLGAHYTSEKNILKLISPLFLDELKAEFNQVKGNTKRLKEFHTKLAKLKFLDPACGCGNFLVIAYRELRILELDILRILIKKTDTLSLNVAEFNIQCDVDQFYGIEIEEFPAQIAQTALWLMDHQMNMQVSEEFGNYFVRLPLKKSATIIHGNALQLDWMQIVQPKELSFILGNPPFVGAKYMSDTQRQDVAIVFHDLKNFGLLDYVAGWHRKSAAFMAVNPAIKAALVSTNSITQGEQVGVLWPDLIQRKVKIHFAHRTFQWSSEARGGAAVHCVIIGFALHDIQDKQIFDYETVLSEPHQVKAKNINPYLVDAPDLVMSRRSAPISPVTKIGVGNKPIDDGNYLFTPEERDDFVKAEPASASYFRRWIGSKEFINGYERFCLWLGDCSPEKLRKMPESMKRVDAVRRFRLSSDSTPTKKLADTPTQFHVENIPKSSFLLIPKVSSERRAYIPLGFIEPETLVSDLVFIFPNATLYDFGILSSTMHMAWTRTVCGRLKSDYRYSAGIVYNNFPWPTSVTDKQRKSIEEASQSVLDTRAQFATSSLADLYDPLTMPPELVKAHNKLNATVDATYSKKKFLGDSDRVAFLFELYQQLETPLTAQKKTRRSTRQKATE